MRSSGRYDLFYQGAPFPWVNSEKFFMTHIVCMDDGILKNAPVALQVFFAHPCGVEDMDRGLAVVNVMRERCSEVGLKLTLQALFGNETHIIFIAAGDRNKGSVVRVRIGHLFSIAFLHKL